MPSVPLPFVVALLLLIVLARLVRREDGTSNPLFAAMIGAYALQSILLGLRWGYGFESLRHVMPILASGLPALSWVAFSAFAAGHAGHPRWRELWPHAVPPLAMAVTVAALPALIDALLIPIFLGYGVALILLARSGPDGLDKVRLEGAIPLHRALQGTGALRIFSAVTVMVIALGPFGQAGIPRIAGLGNLCVLALLGIAAIVAGRNVPAEASAEAPAAPTPEADTDPDPDDARIMAQLDATMIARDLYRDPDLSLDRLARRMGLPARRISAAINRTRAINVSQYVNEHRVAAACRSLRETDAPITRILFDAGFQTKSNFNREFLRVTGMSPSHWRAAQDAPTLSQAGSAGVARARLRPEAGAARS